MRKLLKLTLGLLLCAGSALIPHPTHASGSWDNFGLGARASGMGSAFTGVADDGSAVFYNPAGITQVDKASAVVGGVYGQFAIDFNGSEQSIREWQGADLGIGIKVPFGGFLTNRIYFGLGVHLGMPKLLQEHVTPRTAQPFYFRYEDAQRMAANVILGIRLLKGLSIGGGASGLLHMNRMSFDLGSDASGAGTVSSDLAGLLAISPLGGIFLEPGQWSPSLKRLRIGAVYRTQNDIENRLSTSIVLSGISIPFVINQDLSVDPEQAALGASYLFGKSLLFATDITWKNWSSIPSPYVTIPFGGIIDDLGLDLDIIAPEIKFKDTYVPRAGLEYTFFPDEKDHFIARAGYWFEESPVPPQTGETNLLDNDQHVITAGAGLVIGKFFKSELDPPFSADLSLQYHLLEDRKVTKDDGTTTDTEGSFWVAGFSATIRF
ncbi:MAG: outer membrane protein transport protein [Deltaproteobacteria bacterium]|nr:outer membrane protein transport protein [Deltaproteobacteria bacterium]